MRHYRIVSLEWHFLFSSLFLVTAATAKVILCQSLPPWQNWISMWNPIWIIQLCPACDWKLLCSRELTQGRLKKHPYNCCQYYNNKSKALLCEVQWESSYCDIFKMKVRARKQPQKEKWLKRQPWMDGGGCLALKDNWCDSFLEEWLKNLLFVWLNTALRTIKCCFLLVSLLKYLWCYPCCGVQQG